MTKFEHMINKGQLGTRTINAIINDIHKDNTFDAWINATSLQEIDSKLPEGYEMDIATTLQNYFDHNTINKFEAELVHSRYIYHEDFEKLYDGGFYQYTEGLKNDKLSICRELDSKF